MGVHVGDRVNIFWPRDNRSYSGTITEIEGDQVNVLYDDGDHKTYPMSEILRFGAGKVRVKARVRMSDTLRFAACQVCV